MSRWSLGWLDDGVVALLSAPQSAATARRHLGKAWEANLIIKLLV